MDVAAMPAKRIDKKKKKREKEEEIFFSNVPRFMVAEEEIREVTKKTMVTFDRTRKEFFSVC